MKTIMKTRFLQGEDNDLCDIFKSGIFSLTCKTKDQTFNREKIQNKGTRFEGVEKN